MTKKLSVGVDSTLENWHKLCITFFGETSRATEFIKEKIDEQGPQEEVIADEGQMILLLTNLHLGVEEKGESDQEATVKDHE